MSDAAFRTCKLFGNETEREDGGDTEQPAKSSGDRPRGLGRYTTEIIPSVRMYCTVLYCTVRSSVLCTV